MHSTADHLLTEIERDLYERSMAHPEDDDELWDMLAEDCTEAMLRAGGLA